MSRRSVPPRASSPPPSARARTGPASLAVALLGVMAAVVAAQTDRQAPVDELSRAALIEQIERRSDTLDALQGQVGKLTRSNAEAAVTSTAHPGPARRDPDEAATRRAGHRLLRRPRPRGAAHGREPPRRRRQRRDPRRGPGVPGRRALRPRARRRSRQRPADHRSGRDPQHPPSRSTSTVARSTRRSSSRPSATRRPSRRACCRRARGWSGSAASTSTDSSTRPRMSMTSACPLRASACCVM